MRSQRFLALLICLVLLRAGTAMGIAASADSELIAALRHGTAVVLIVATPERVRQTNEAYADWAEYLNRFSAQADRRLRIIKTTTSGYRRIIAEPPLKSAFTTLFIRDPAHALQYDGMILEPQIYQLGEAFLLQSGEFASDSNYGLQPTKVRLR